MAARCGRDEAVASQNGLVNVMCKGFNSDEALRRALGQAPIRVPIMRHYFLPSSLSTYLSRKSGRAIEMEEDKVSG